MILKIFLIQKLKAPKNCSLVEKTWTIELSMK